MRPLIPRAGAIDAAAVVKTALDDPFLRGDLIARDASVVSIVVNFDEDRVDAERARTIERVRAAVDRHLTPGLRAYYNGSLEISETYNRVTVANTVKFTPPILLMTVAALFILFRSWRITLLTLGAVLVSVLWALGLYSLMGFSFNVLSSMLVPLVVVLAIADDVHIVQHYTEAFERTGSREEAFVDHGRLRLPAAARGRRHDRAGHAVARHQPRPCGALVRHRRRRRRDGRPRHLDRPGADAARVRAEADHGAAAGALADGADAPGRRHHLAPARAGARRSRRCWR